jgi:hypothetical protein
MPPRIVAVDFSTKKTSREIAHSVDLARTPMGTGHDHSGRRRIRPRYGICTETNLRSED